MSQANSNELKMKRISKRSQPGQEVSQPLIRKKRKGEAVIVELIQKERSTPDSALACKALTIVLQHWMVPKLGWNMDSLEQRLPRLRDAIVDHRVKLRDVRDKTEEEKDQLKDKMRAALETDVGYLDPDLGKFLYENVVDRDPLDVLEAYQIQVTKFKLICLSHF